MCWTMSCRQLYLPCMFERQSLKLYFCIVADIFILHNFFRVGTLVTKFPLVQMYPVAKNYFGGLLQAHSFSGYVPTFAFSNHVEMKGRSKPLTHPECRSTRSKQ